MRMSEVTLESEVAPRRRRLLHSECWSEGLARLPASFHADRDELLRLMRKDALKARLVLSVNLIGQAVSVEVDAADVKAY